jgi:hypothetical protein
MRIVIPLLIIAICPYALAQQVLMPPQPTEAESSATSLESALAFASAQLNEAQSMLRDAQMESDRARASCRARLEANDVFKQVVANMNAAEFRLVGVQTHASSKEQTDAFYAYILARTAFAQMRLAAVLTDEAARDAGDRCAAASARVRELRKQVKSLAGELARQLEARRIVKEQEERDAKTFEVSAARLETMGETVFNQRVKLSNVRFRGADNQWVYKLPSVMIHSSDGLRPPILNTMELERWIGFSIVDAHHNGFAKCFALKATYGEALIGYQRGQRLTIYGTVVKLDQPGWYGLVCDRIEEIKTDPSELE